MIEQYLQLLQQQQKIFGNLEHEYYQVATTKERKRAIRGPFEEARKTICKEVQEALDGVFPGKFFVTFITAHPHLRLPSIQCLYIYATTLPDRARSGITGGPYVRVFSPAAQVPNGAPMVSFRVAAGEQMAQRHLLLPFYQEILGALGAGAVQLAPEGYVEINGGAFEEFAHWVAHPNEQGAVGQVISAYNAYLTPDLVAALYPVMPQGAVGNFIQPPVPQPPPEPDIDFSFPLQAISSRNAILYGPPGTGKTYATVSVAAQLIAGNQGQPQSWTMLKDMAANEGV
jgi:hypothetical protein